MARLTAEEAAKHMGLPTPEAPTAPKVEATPPATAAPTETPTIGETSPAATPASTPDATSTAPVPETSPEEKSDESGTTTPEWWKAIEKVDRRELAKNPVVSGLVGDLAAKQAKKIAKEAEADRALAAAKEAEAAKLREIDRLLVEDPYKGRDEKFAHDAELAERQKALDGYRRTSEELFASLSPESQKKLSGRTYPGTAEQGFAAFQEDVAELRADERANDLAEQRASVLIEQRIAKEKAAWEKETREALRRELLSEQNGQEPSVDVARGNGTSTKKVWTQREVEKLTPAQYASHRKEILDQYAHGGLT